MQNKKLTSYGIIPVYKEEDKIYVCAVHNIKSDEWGLPKGSPEKGETSFETAKRELEEETGIVDFEIIGGKIFSESYSFEQDGVVYDKENVYWIASVDEMKVSEDIDSADMKWFEIDKAKDVFSFDNISELLDEVKEYLSTFPLVTEYTGYSGETAVFEYYHADDISHLPQDKLSQVQIVAFHNDKLFIVNNTDKPGTYGLAGGSIEKGETPEECVVRELYEETNTKPTEMKLIGYQKTTNLSRPEKDIEYQLRYYAKVEKLGEFDPNHDPDGDVTELLEINVDDYKEYFNWGETGDAIIERAKKFHN